MRRRNSPVPNNGCADQVFERKPRRNGGKAPQKKKGKLREAQFALWSWRLGFLFWLLRADGRWGRTFVPLLVSNFYFPIGICEPDSDKPENQQNQRKNGENQVQVCAE